MAVVGELLVLIGGNSAALTASLAKSEAELKGFSATAAGTGNAGSTAFAGLRAAALGVGVVAVAALGMGVKAAADFQEQMAIINTIARQTPVELTKTGDAIRGMAVSSGVPLSDLTSAFYDLLSVGVPVNRAMEVLGNSVTLSIGGLSTTKEAVNAITTAMNAWSIATGDAKLGMADSAKVMDIFAKAVETGGMTAAEIPTALATVAPVAAALGVPLEEVGAAWAVMTTKGETASTAATSLNAALLALQKIPPGMQLLQDATGKSYEQIAKTDGIHSAMQQLVDDAKKYGVSLIDVVGRQEALAYINDTTGAAAPAYAAALANMYDSSGTAAGQAAERSQTFNRQMAILGESINNVAINIGTALLPPLTSFVQFVSGVVQGISVWTAANAGLASNILLIAAGVGALAAATLVLGPVFGAIGTVFGIITSPMLVFHAVLSVIGSMLGFILSPIGLIVAAVAVLALAWANNWFGMRDVVSNVVAAIGPIISGIGAVLAPVGAQIGDTLGSAVSTVSGWAAALASAFDPLLTPGQALATLRTQFGLAAPDIANIVAVIRDAVTSAFTFITQTVLPAVGPAFRTMVGVVGPMISTIGAQIGPAFRTMVGVVVSVMGVIGSVVHTVIDGIRTFISINLPTLSSIFSQVFGAIRAVVGFLGDAFRFVLPIIAGVVSVLATILPPIGTVVFAALGVAATILLRVIDGAFKLIGGVVQAAATVISALVQGIGAVFTVTGAVIGVAATVIKAMVEGIGAIFTIVAGVIGVAVAVIKALVAGIGTAVQLVAAAIRPYSVTFGTIFGAIATAIKIPIDVITGLINGIASVVSTVAEKVSGFFDWLTGKNTEVRTGLDATSAAAAAALAAAQTAANAQMTGLTNVHAYPPGYVPPPTTGITAQGPLQHGGVISGTGAQLAIVHGGETVIPAGQGAGGITLVNHTHVSLDGREIMDFVEQQLFRNAGISSSGFQANNPVTSA